MPGRDGKGGKGKGAEKEDGSRLESVLRWVSVTGMRRGLGGEGWVWLALALTATVWRRARRETPENFVVTGLRPGDRLAILAMPELTRRQRRKEQRAKNAEKQRANGQRNGGSEQRSEGPS